MSTVLETLSAPARNLYENGILKYAVNGLCKASQRELIAATGMAFKTLIVARDELVAKGLLIRHCYAYQGKRDWYKVVDLDQVAAAQRRAIRQERRRADAAAAEHEMSLPLQIGR